MRPLESLDMLQRMCHISALSGHEEGMIAFMKSEMQRYLPDCYVDRLGNVIGCVPGTDAQGPKVMVFAHMDEVGFVVRKIEADGFLRLTRVGGVPEKSLLAQRVVVHGRARDLFGVIGPKAHHLTPSKEKLRVVEIQHLFVDIGARDKAEAEAWGVYVGAPVTYQGFFQEMPGGQIAGKAIDNRVGCFVLLQLLRLLIQKQIRATVYLVGSVQEEFNIRGVVPAAFAINPDLAIGLDVSIASDTPDLKGHSDIALGEGPVIGHYSFHGRGTLCGLIPNPKLRQYLEDTAGRLGIPVQHGVFMGGLTDASYLAVVREGIPAVDLGFPMRYSHSPIEVASVGDIEKLILLLAAALEGVSADLDLSRG